MSPMLHIRKSVLNLTQAELAKVAGVGQSTVSKWESREFEPRREELDRIRAYAFESGIAWDDSWFFEVPESV